MFVNNLFKFKLFNLVQIQRNPYRTNPCITKTPDHILHSSKSKINEKEPRYNETPVITNTFCQSLGTTLYRVFTAAVIFSTKKDNHH